MRGGWGRELGGAGGEGGEGELGSWGGRDSRDGFLTAKKAVRESESQRIVAWRTAAQQRQQYVARMDAQQDLDPADFEDDGEDEGTPADVPRVEDVTDDVTTLLPGVRYREVKRGQGPAADYKQSIVCSYTCEGTDTGAVFERCERRTLKIGDADVPPGLELALRRQREGTSCVVDAEWRFAFGEDGRAASREDDTAEIPPRTNVTWRLETHALGLCDGEASGRDKLHEARTKKDLGNGHFRHHMWKKAAQNYQEVLKELHVADFEGEARAEAEQIYVACANNLVVTLMKLGEWLKAEQAVCDVLGVAPDDEKALYLAARVALHLTKWEEARAAISKGLRLFPASPAFPRLEAALRTQRARYKARNKEMGARMAGALFEVAAAPAPAPAPARRICPWLIVLGGCGVVVAVSAVFGSLLRLRDDGGGEL